MILTSYHCQVGEEKRLYKRYPGSGALGPSPLARASVLVPVTRTLILVAVSPRRHAVALLAAYPTVLEAPALKACLRAPHFALGIAKS